MYYTVYKTTNLITDKIYIGCHKTDNLLDDGYLGSGKYLNNAINKYGKENFSKDIIAICDTEEEMYKLEKELVNETFLKFFSTYNIRLGGEGGFDHINSNYVLKRKAGIVSQNKIRNNPTMYKAKLDRWKIRSLLGSQKARLVYNRGFLGKTHTKESKIKISNKLKLTSLGSRNSQFGTCWITNDSENKKIIKGSEVPNGWRLGRIKYHKL